LGKYLSCGVLVIAVLAVLCREREKFIRHSLEFRFVLFVQPFSEKSFSQHFSGDPASPVGM
jgi:hypothetical protein